MSKLFIESLPETNDTESEARFLGRITHEMIHGQSFQSVTMSSPDENSLVATERRIGIVVTHPDQSAHQGAWLNEALTEQLNVLFHRYLLSDDVVDGNLKPFAEAYISISHGVYAEERLMLHFLVEALHKEFSEKYPSEADIYKLFFDAMLNGRLLPIARLIEKKFGKKSFREVMSLSSENVTQIVESMFPLDDNEISNT